MTIFAVRLVEPAAQPKQQGCVNCLTLNGCATGSIVVESVNHHRTAHNQLNIESTVSSVKNNVFLQNIVHDLSVRQCSIVVESVNHHRTAHNQLNIESTVSSVKSNVFLQNIVHDLSVRQCSIVVESVNHHRTAHNQLNIESTVSSVKSNVFLQNIVHDLSVRQCTHTCDSETLDLLALAIQLAADWKITKKFKDEVKAWYNYLVNYFSTPIYPYGEDGREEPEEEDDDDDDRPKPNNRGR